MKFSTNESSAGKFFKMNPGESVRAIFRGDPVTFKKHWVENKGYVCIGEECIHCGEGNHAKFRFYLNILLKENGAFTAKIWEQGWTVYEALKALHEGDYDLEKHLMKITRNGSGTDTTYSIVPVPNGSLSKEDISQISSVPLIPLGNDKSGVENELPF